MGAGKGCVVTGGQGTPGTTRSRNRKAADVTGERKVLYPLSDTCRIVLPQLVATKETNEPNPSATLRSTLNPINLPFPVGRLAAGAGAATEASNSLTDLYVFM